MSDNQQQNKNICEITVIVGTGVAAGAGVGLLTKNPLGAVVAGVGAAATTGVIAAKTICPLLTKSSPKIKAGLRL